MPETVLLATFCEVVGTESSTVRSAIQTKALPFRDYTPGVDDDGRTPRRRYTVSDAFSWHLMTELSQVWGMRPGGPASAIWRSNAVPGYVADRLAGNDTSKAQFVIAAGKGRIEETKYLTVSHAGPHSWVLSDEAEIKKIGQKYTFVQIVRLDDLFDHFLELAKHRGWGIDASGFTRLRPDNSDD